MNRYDELMTRCPRLGSEITFAYCRIEQGHLPCSRLIACWSPSIPVAAWLDEMLSPGQLEQFTGSSGKDRLTVLFEIVESLSKNK